MAQSTNTVTNTSSPSSFLGSIKNELRSRKFRAVIIATITWLSSQFVVVENVWLFLGLVAAYITNVAAVDFAEKLAAKTNTTITLDSPGATSATRSKRTSVSPIGDVVTEETTAVK